MTDFTGYWPEKNTIVVAHEGTDPTQFESDLTDINIILENLDSTLFPGAPSDVKVHSGFADEQAKTATDILASVKSLLSAHSGASVTTVCRVFLETNRVLMRELLSRSGIRSAARLLNSIRSTSF